jgi:hypothetical protein
MRSVVVALAGVMIGIVGAACGSVTEPGGAPETRRGPVSLADAEAQLTSSTELSVTVPSCNGEPEVVELDESGETIRLEVVTTQVVSGPSDGCLDVVAVVLDRQLGDRQLVDAVSGMILPITDTAAVELLECFDADYPIEPMFDTPEAALEHALEVDVADVPVPRDLVAYERTERSDGWIEFAFRESADRYVTWGVVRYEEGRWGMVSLGGCVPEAG